MKRSTPIALLLMTTWLRSAFGAENHQFTAGAASSSPDIQSDDFGFEDEGHEYLPVNFRMTETGEEEYLGSSSIPEIYRKADTIMIIGRPGKGKSSLCRLLTKATQTNELHALRQYCENDPMMPAGSARNGTELFKSGDSDKDAVTTNTSVVETHLVPLWDPEYQGEDAEAAPLVLIDTPGIGNVTSMANTQEVMDFQSNIINGTLHVNNSYGGINRFIIVERADDNRDEGCAATITHIAKMFGGEMEFMRNLSIVFTHSGAKIYEKATETEKQMARQERMANLQTALYRENGVVANEGVEFVYGVDVKDLQRHQVPCYFIDSIQAETLLDDQRTFTEEEVAHNCSKRTAYQGFRKTLAESSLNLEKLMEEMVKKGYNHGSGEFSEGYGVDATLTADQARADALWKRDSKRQLFNLRNSISKQTQNIAQAHAKELQTLDIEESARRSKAERSQDELHALLTLTRSSRKAALELIDHPTIAHACKLRTEAVERERDATLENNARLEEEKRQNEIALAAAIAAGNEKEIGRLEAELESLNHQLETGRAKAQAQEMELVLQAERATSARNMLTRTSGGTAAAGAGIAIACACPLISAIFAAGAGAAYLAHRDTLTPEQRLAQDARYQDLLRSRDEETDTRRGMISALREQIAEVRARRRSSSAGRGQQGRAAAAAAASPRIARSTSAERGISFRSLASIWEDFGERNNLNTID